MKDYVISKMIVSRYDEEFEIDIEGRVSYSIDTRYAQDADGGRGSRIVEIDDVYDICAYDDEGCYFQMTLPERDKASEILGNKFLEG